MARLVLLALLSSAAGFVAPRAARPRALRSRAAAVAADGAATIAADEEFDAIVIGAGLGGLSCAALLASNGLRVACLEAHEHAGGAAHEWSAGGFRFESGPSLYAGLSPERSPNPMKHVFQIIGEEPEWITYDRWGTALPEGTFAAAVGAEDFQRVLGERGGPDARAQWCARATRARADAPRARVPQI